MKTRTLLLSIFICITSLNAFSQNDNIQPGYLGKKISDFKLQTYQGTELVSCQL